METICRRCSSANPEKARYCFRCGAALADGALPFCSACQLPLEFAGTRQLHEGTRFWDFAGGIFELFKNRFALDTYVCPRCGRVEFFADGLGEELRSEPTEPADGLQQVPSEQGATAEAHRPEWACSRCAAANPRNFEVCWKCGGERPAPSSDEQPTAG